MRLFIIFLSLSLLGWSERLVLDVPAPEYTISNNEIHVPGSTRLHVPGAPGVPCLHLTIAMPPGAVVESVSFHGERKPIGYATIPPTEAEIPLSHDAVVKEILQSREARSSEYYASDRIFPEARGAWLSRGGLRKYTLITVACHHFAWHASSGEMKCAPSIRVEVQYRMPDPGSERDRFQRGLMEDATLDETAKQVIFNWGDARAWYGTSQGRSAMGYVIIIPSILKNAVKTLVDYRKSQGYDVTIVAREYIAAMVAGKDLQEKIRNYLRSHLADIRFVLLVGDYADMPWRSLVPFNNDPLSPYGSPDYSPIPSDLYYAELTDPDDLSWNSDGDDYYGEVYDGGFLPNGDDDPDYHADVHLGRIPFSAFGTVQKICDKMIAFDKDTDPVYKNASLLAGSIYYFDNENCSGNQRIDGADFIEELMNDQVLDRTNAVYMYEKSGIQPCPYPCTAPLTRSNMINFWQRKGVMYECHHGNDYSYARKIWAWDDGDNVPEDFEFQWPTCLHVSDVSLLDDEHPATSFLRSCLCGNPEVTGLGASLLNHGASAVVSSSRIAWMSLKDPGGMPYHFFNRLMKDKKSSKGIIGVAYDMARCDFMDNTGFWLPAYHYNLFGDPALRQFGWQRIVKYPIPPVKTK